MDSENPFRRRTRVRFSSGKDPPNWWAVNVCLRRRAGHGRSSVAGTQISSGAKGLFGRGGLRKDGVDGTVLLQAFKRTATGRDSRSIGEAQGVLRLTSVSGYAIREVNRYTCTRFCSFPPLRRLLWPVLLRTLNTFNSH
jgi:hypothetical protein